MQGIVFVNTELGYDCGGSGRHWLLWPWEITPMVSTIITCQRYGDVKNESLLFIRAYVGGGRNNNNKNNYILKGDP